MIKINRQTVAKGDKEQTQSTKIAKSIVSTHLICIHRQCQTVLNIGRKLLGGELRNPFQLGTGQSIPGHIPYSLPGQRLPGCLKQKIFIHHPTRPTLESLTLNRCSPAVVSPYLTLRNCKIFRPLNAETVVVPCRVPKLGIVTRGESSFSGRGIAWPGFGTVQSASNASKYR